MYKNALRPAWVEINLNNLDFNIKNIKAKIGDREMIGVIKADAYGHGSVKVAEVLRENGCKTFAVATLHEAVTLREAGAKEEIIILGLTPDMYASTIVDYDITPVVCNSENAAAFDALFCRLYYGFFHSGRHFVVLCFFCRNAATAVYADRSLR